MSIAIYLFLLCSFCCCRFWGCQQYGNDNKRKLWRKLYFFFYFFFSSVVCVWNEKRNRFGWRARETILILGKITQENYNSTACEMGGSCLFYVYSEIISCPIQTEAIGFALENLKLLLLLVRVLHAHTVTRRFCFLLRHQLNSFERCAHTFNHWHLAAIESMFAASSYPARARSLSLSRSLSLARGRSISLRSISRLSAVQRLTHQHTDTPLALPHKHTHAHCVSHLLSNRVSIERKHFFNFSRFANALTPKMFRHSHCDGHRSRKCNSNRIEKSANWNSEKLVFRNNGIKEFSSIKKPNPFDVCACSARVHRANVRLGRPVIYSVWIHTHTHTYTPVRCRSQRSQCVWSRLSMNLVYVNVRIFRISLFIVINAVPKGTTHTAHSTTASIVYWKIFETSHSNVEKRQLQLVGVPFPLWTENMDVTGQSTRIFTITETKQLLAILMAPRTQTLFKDHKQHGTVWNYVYKCMKAKLPRFAKNTRQCYKKYVYIYWRSYSFGCVPCSNIPVCDDMLNDFMCVFVFVCVCVLVRLCVWIENKQSPNAATAIIFRGRFAIGMKISKESIMSWSGPRWMASNDRNGCTGRKWTTSSIRCHRTNFAQISIIGSDRWAMPRPPTPHWTRQPSRAGAWRPRQNCETQNRSASPYSRRIQWVSQKFHVFIQWWW